MEWKSERKKKMPKEGDKRVWWIPQIPMKAFYVPVRSVDEAMYVLEILARYDSFQFLNNVKPDYSNTGGLQIFEDDEWVEWSNIYDDDIHDLMGEKEDEMLTLWERNECA